jgi:hypothetical protein
MYGFVKNYGSCDKFNDRNGYNSNSKIIGKSSKISEYWQQPVFLTCTLPNYLYYNVTY